MASDLEVLAAWVLLGANAMSLVYEVWRATTKAGTSRHDSIRVLFVQGPVIYGTAAVVVILLFLGVAGSAWVGLVFALVSIAVSIGYYNPVVMSERAPGMVDWVEDLIFTGLLFVAAALLLLDGVGRTLA